jgi:hypothetical protein
MAEEFQCKKMPCHQKSTEKQTVEANKLQTAWTYSGKCGSQQIPRRNYQQQLILG